jgi:HPt (histidine-containing phosphotransfer) domain-containing protein
MSRTLDYSLPSLNLQGALERIGGDEELLVDIAAVFLTEYPELLNEMQDAVASADADVLQRSAHTLKGSLLAIGAERAAELALELEMQGRQQKAGSATESLRELSIALRDVHRDVTTLTEQGL